MRFFTVEYKSHSYHIKDVMWIITVFAFNSGAFFILIILQGDVSQRSTHFFENDESLLLWAYLLGTSNTSIQFSVGFGISNTSKSNT